MPKVNKEMSITGADGKVYAKLPFQGYQFSDVDEALAHPDCVGMTDIEGMSGKQFSIMGFLNSARDLQERARVRPVWKARIEGPSKAFITGAKALIKVFQSIGKTLSMDEAVKKVYAESGVDPNVTVSVDLTTPVDVDTIGVDEVESEEAAS